MEAADQEPPQKRSPFSVSALRAAFVSAVSWRRRQPSHVTLTLFGRRRGHVFIAFHVSDLRRPPAALVELSAATCQLTREMSSGLVRLALECRRRRHVAAAPLLEEDTWQAFCNGRKWGPAARREVAAAERRVLAAVGPASMGAGVLPWKEEDEEGEVMYMRGRFERVVGSRDSEAFYMVNPDGNAGPELSIYLLRV